MTLGTVLVATGVSGPYRSTDSGASWVRSTEGLEAALASAVVVDAARRDRLVAGTHGDGIHWTNDRGRSWQRATGLPFDAFVLELAAAVTNPAIQYGEKGTVTFAKVTVPFG